MTDERCLGSRVLPLADSIVEEEDTATGECPVCGRRVILGYAGLLPDHRPLNDEGV